jgi:hypothetical protein
MLAALFGQWRVVPGRESAPDEPSTSSSNTSDEINLVGDQYENMRDKMTKLQWWDLWALGISTAVGGHFYVWNVCFHGGLGSFAIVYFFVASGYGMLALCLAELSSALPFAGTLFRSPFHSHVFIRAYYR